jgi:cell division protein FtsI (penicillin-binding protein 3)
VKNKKNLRINSIYFIFSLLFFILFLRIAYLQIFKKSLLEKLSQTQHYRLFRLEGKRGNIFDCKGRILATGINSYSIFADPSIIPDPISVAEVLSSNLNLPKEVFLNKLSDRRKKFIWIKRKVSWDVKKRIEELRLKGVGFLKEERRFYPQGSLASHILGRVDIDNNGIEGIELIYDNFLKGKNGWVKVLQDSTSQIIFTPEIIDPYKGADIILTIDAQIQYWTEKYLSQTVEDFDAKGGSVIIMDASNGDIIALANYPTFTPNTRNLEHTRNQAICDIFEPGSVFKIVTLIAAIEENKFSEEDKIFCENGKFKIPGSILHDWKPYGELSFKDVFKKSSNIGVSKIANICGRESIYRYIRRLGFGKKTGIDLPGEAKGIVKVLKDWSNTSSYIIPIGQEIGVTLIQLVCAFSAIVNDGYLVKPHLLKSIRFEKGEVKNFTGKKRKVISSRASKKAKDILIEVVREGTGKLAFIEGVKIGGKTGTAQKYDPSLNRYSSTKYRATFVGFIADSKSPLVIGVTIDEPKKHHFGGVVAAPLFKKIAEKVIKYLGTEKTLVKS